MNYDMVKRALCVALGLVGACFSAVAEQDPAVALNLYQPNVSGPADNFLLFHRGPLRTWSDGGWLASQNALSQIGMASLDFFPAGFLPPDALGSGFASRGNGAGNSRSLNAGTDGKDSPNQLMSSSLNPVYYGGEVGFVYGQWSGKGGGDMWETYVVGTVGNDKFQITAGAAFDEWNGNGRSVRFRSFAAPR